MIRNKEKTAAILDVRALLHEEAGRKLLVLLHLLIEELRIANDTVIPDELLKNQGKIEAYTQLRDYLERGLPTIP